MKRPPETPSLETAPISHFLGGPDELLEAGLMEPPLFPGVLGHLGTYRIHTEIGRGGMGVVFLGRRSTIPTQHRPDASQSNFVQDAVGPRATLLLEGPSADPTGNASRDGCVAIKILRPDWSRRRRALDRFLAEARHMRQFDHPHIVRVREVSSAGEYPYFVMPYLEGGSLARALHRHGPLPEADMLRVARQLANALAYAHSRGIVHRDLKPANVLLSATGDAFLSDFGLARTVFNDSIADIHREHGEGTAPYMSPAVAAGEAEDTRCDIYGFGALLFEMLTGRPPYLGRNPAEIRRHILERPPPAIHTLNSNAPAGLALVAESAMARQLRHRYAQMADVVLDLDRLAQGAQPLGPRGQPRTRWRPKPLKPPHRFRLRLPSRPWIAAAAAAIVLGGLCAVWQLQLQPQPHTPRPSIRLTLSGKPASPNPTRPPATPTTPTPETLPSFLAHDGDLLMLAPAPSNPDPSAQSIPSNSPHPTSRTTPPGNLAVRKRFRFRGLPEFASQSSKPWPDMAAVHLDDLDRDGRQELLVRVGASSVPSVCGLYCFDFDDSSLRWRRLIGPAIHQVLSADLDGDGPREIYAGTTATGQGRQGPDGSSDDCSYLYRLDAAGAIRWRVACGGLGTRAHPIVADLDGDRHPELLVWIDPLRTGPGSRQPPPPSRIGCLHPDGQLVQVHEATTFFWDCQAVDLDQDGRHELLVTDDSGSLLVLEAGLRTRARRQVTADTRRPVRLLLQETRDLENDGYPELVLSVSHPVAKTRAPSQNRPPAPDLWGDHEIVVLRHNLSPLWRATLSEPPDHGVPPRVSLVLDPR